MPSAASAALAALVVVLLPATDAGAQRAKECQGRKATIVGTQGPDQLRATRQEDVIATLGGRDRVREANSGDIVCAGAGADRVRARMTKGGGRRDRGSRVAPGNALAPGMIEGGPGDDRIFVGCSAPAAAGLEGGVEVAALGGNDVIDVSCPARDGVTGGDGDDRITAGAGFDGIEGGAGDDVIIDQYSAPGGDCQEPPPQPYPVPGEDRRCTIIVDGGDSLVAGPVWGFWDDHFYGGEGNDTLRGGEGPELLSAGPGRDVLDAGPGDDALSGGNGYDVCDGGPGEDLIGSYLPFPESDCEKTARIP